MSEKNSIHVPGTGVDLNFFKPTEIPENYSAIDIELNKYNQKTSFLLIARILWDKGVGEYISAARLVKKNFPNIKFKILGFLDVSNPSAIPRDTFNKWIEEGIIEFLGQTDDVRPYISACDCVVLPSYREGLPRTLLEAASMGRPIITTNVPGCKDTLINGLTGFMCEPADVDDLANKICDFLLLSIDFVSLDDLLNWLYPNTTNAYTHFANDFPAKWFKIRKMFESNDKDKIWKSRFDQIVLGIYLPLVNNSSCVLLTFIDLNQIIPDEVSVGNYESLEKSFSDVVPPGKIPINIIQLLNHFEPIQINEYVGKLEDIEQVANKDFLD